jgi:ribosomal protein S27E
MARCTIATVRKTSLTSFVQHKWCPAGTYGTTAVAENGLNRETGLSQSYALSIRRHRPEQMLLDRLIEQYYPDFEMRWASEGRVLPDYVRREFDDYLKCGRLEHGFLRVQCASCHAEHLVAFSCKRRVFCPSCDARRMLESAALLVDEVLPHQPMCQWVLSVPFPLWFLFASQSKIMGIAVNQSHIIPSGIR